MHKTTVAALLGTVLIGVLCGCTPKPACAAEPSSLAIVIPEPHEVVRHIDPPTGCG